MEQITTLGPHRLTLGEGPGYDGETGVAWWFDIHERRLFTRHWPGDATEVCDLPAAASALAFTTTGEQLLLSEHGIMRRDGGNGSLSLCHPFYVADLGLRSNDARVHPSGAWWISMMGKDGQPGAGAIHHWFRGELRLLWPDMTTPNAICFSPDGTCAYFTDTPTGRINKVATDPLNGLPMGAPQVFHQFADAHPDGAVTDDQGRLWVALWGGGCVICLNAAAETVAEIPIPAPHVTCPAWVGPDLDEMLVTTAKEGMSPAQLARHEGAGATFHLAPCHMPPGARGWPTPRVQP